MISSQGRIFSKLRARMSEESCEAQLWLNLNYWKVNDNSKVVVEAKKRLLARAKKRAAKEDAYNALVRKRMRA